MLRDMSEIVPAEAAEGNAKAYSVSELAFALKRTLEEAYGFVRLRGEISKVTRHGNGHIYLDLKDENACIAGVVWKGQVRGLKVQPEQGLEVIVTGRITTFAPRSSYQLIIETMEHAGVGALLAQLERLKARLRDEGLFEVSRKKPLPGMPTVVGVVTSPTGAVIRDILHRIRDRWPMHVIVWPVVVQGPDAAAQVATAIRGFNALQAGGAIPRPEVLIVARGGGSIEDLWPFNDEALARTVVECPIPLISAVGHETDTTLIDFVSDRRAPTPTAAAELATPVLAELKALVSDLGARMHRCGGRVVDERRRKIEHADRALKRVPDLVRLAEQRFDIVSGKLGAGLAKNAAVHERDLVRVASRLTPLLLQRPQAVQKDRLDRLAVRLEPSVRRRLERLSERLDGLSKLYASVDPDRPLQRGFARVTRADGSIVHAGATLAGGEEVSIKFGDKVTRQAVIDGSGGGVPAAPAAPKPARAKPKAEGPAQGDLF
jgi:exodeoxyribonuclease VII large subunit